MIAEYVEEVLLDRRSLVAPPDGLPPGPAQRVRALVAAAPVSLELVVDSADRGMTVDGWLGTDGLAWHARGDLDTPRSAVAAPAPHLAATVCRLVGLGLRHPAAADARVVVPLDAVRAQLGGGPAVVPGGVARVWTFGWRSPDDAGGFGVVDEGPKGAVWTVSGVDGDDVELRPVTPLEIWSRLATLQSAVALAT